MKKNKVFQSLTLVTQFGISMLVPVLSCTLVGAYLGNKLSIPVLAVPLFLLGAAAGFRNIYILAKNVFDDKEHDHVKKD